MFYVYCDNDCRYEALTKEEVLAAIEQALEQGYVSDPTSAVFSKIKEINKNGTAQIWIGTEAEFNTLTVDYTSVIVRLASDGTMYLCEDDSALSVLGNLGAVATENIVPISKGGTGATSASDARTNLGLGSVSTESVVPVNKGGTGATSAANARINLGFVIVDELPESPVEGTIYLVKRV